MKKLFFALGFFALGFAGYSQNKNEVLAVPDNNQGFYIFCQSKPAGEYQFLGSEKIRLVSLSTSECESRVIKRAKEYPEANGLILKGLNYCEVEVIKIEN